MATDRLRVVPENSHRGLPATAALLGVMIGLVFAWLVYLALVCGYMPASAALMMLLGTGVFLAIAITVVTQKWTVIAFAGAAYWVTVLLTAETAGFVTGSRTGPQSMDSETLVGRVVGIVIEMLGGALIGSMLGLCALAFTRTLVFRTVEQDGLLCWRCGYSTGSDRVPKCPECGTPVEPAKFRWNWIHRVVAAGRRFGLIACLVLFSAGAVAVAWTWSAGAASPVSRFSERMRRFGPVEPEFAMVIGASPLVAGEPSVGVRLPLDPAKSLELVVLPLVRDANGAVMQLKVGRTPVSVEGYGTEEVIPVPNVLCNLNAVQAEIVMTEGVPQSLKNALLNAAATVSWDGWSGVGAPPPNIGVDPTSHFPAE